MYTIQANCTGLGWVNTRHSAPTLEAAKRLQKELLLTDEAWMPGKRESRIASHDGITSIITIGA